MKRFLLVAIASSALLAFAPQWTSAVAKGSVQVLAFRILVPPAVAYTGEDAKVCVRDVFKLCSSAVPDVSKVAKCMREKRDQLNLSHVPKRSTGFSPNRGRQRAPIRRIKA